ncbi:DUF7882 family protein [Planctomonas psychrotolerans]|uniref:DUF7882 family protein n=1 Tax=Planctomonas psychrotolerans TaxID=2528712 RepID=UPI00123BC60F|nr:ATP-dependent DNA ligase [Planctomonas psychrotolerans]
MGRLVYGHAGFEIPMDDRPLAHLQVVMGSKLRRHESFLFSWANGVANGSGRGAAWIHPSVPLLFLYSGNGHPQLNREWLDRLIELANSPQGLHIVDEPAPSATERPHGDV